jgi:anti-sigma factor (TIGR02949 family)
MSKMECFENESELSQYVDDEILGNRRGALDIHIEVCNKCLNQLVAWKKLKGLIRGTSKYQKAPLELKERINQAILGIDTNGDFMVWDSFNKPVNDQPAFPSKL